MPTVLPQRPRRPARRPENDNEDKTQSADLFVPAMIVCTLLFANIVMFCEKFAPPHYYYASGADYSLTVATMDLQYSP